MGFFNFFKRDISEEEFQEQQKVKRGLEKTRTGFFQSIVNTLTNAQIDDDLYDQLEEQLILADVGPACAVRLVDELHDEVEEKHLKTGQEALDAIAQTPDIGVAILDIMVPGDMDGFEVCKALRDGGSNVPIIMLTAREDETDKVFGLEIGADDYITKPFSIRELMARVKANIRRSAAAAGAVPPRSRPPAPAPEP